MCVWQLPYIGGPGNRPQYIIILIAGTPPPMVPLNFRKPPYAGLSNHKAAPAKERNILPMFGHPENPHSPVPEPTFSLSTPETLSWKTNPKSSNQFPSLCAECQVQTSND